MSDTPVAVVPGGMSMPSRGNESSSSVVVCPVCGARTPVRIRTGEIVVYCRKCAATVVVSIRVIYEEVWQQVKAGMPDKPVDVVTEGPARSPPEKKPKYSDLICPVCGARTGIRIQIGEIEVCCSNCASIVGVSIRILNEDVRKEAKAGQ